MADACKALGAPEIAGAWIERKGFAKKGMNAIASAEIGGLLGTAVGTGLSGKGTPKPTAETPSFGAYGYLALSANDLVLVKAKQGLTGMKLTDDVIASVPDAPSPPPSSARARSPPRLRSSSATAAPGSSKSRAPVIAGRSESLLNSALDVSAMSIYDTGCRRVRGRRARSPVAGGARQAGWDRPGGCRTALGGTPPIGSPAGPRSPVPSSPRAPWRRSDPRSGARRCDDSPPVQRSQRAAQLLTEADGIPFPARRPLVEYPGKMRQRNRALDRQLPFLLDAIVRPDLRPGSASSPKHK